MSEKPFWEGKTCEEMANLHVKVTFVAGAVLTGITDEELAQAMDDCLVHNQERGRL